MSYKLKNQLAECRATKGINKSRLAQRLGKSRAYVTRLERGEINPCLEVALRLARYFKRPVEEIFQIVGDDNQFSGPVSAEPENSQPTKTENHERLKCS